MTRVCDSCAYTAAEKVSQTRNGPRVRSFLSSFFVAESLLPPPSSSLASFSHRVARFLGVARNKRIRYEFASPSTLPSPFTLPRFTRRAERSVSLSSPGTESEVLVFGEKNAELRMYIFANFSFLSLPHPHLSLSLENHPSPVSRFREKSSFFSCSAKLLLFSVVRNRRNDRMGERRRNEERKERGFV